MGVREQIEQSPSQIESDAREEAISGDLKFWDWVVTEPQWAELVEKWVERRISEHYIRI